jgi:hypothetical protein
MPPAFPPIDTRKCAGLENSTRRYLEQKESLTNHAALDTRAGGDVTSSVTTENFTS